ncbi:hypothetical protein PMAYCL1PPCAC_00683 [Pristionchus mayeri]|uniref:Uncharacterized protein n=1 Tax=Pristionchus mayeri TaxID=1317129 RepID=A0AAN4YWW6_9BILA|nr:hypothetical protein PMAYCL1PPCAC_00683 [Pristionchus mayeri]
MWYALYQIQLKMSGLNYEKMSMQTVVLFWLYNRFELMASLQAPSSPSRTHPSVTSHLLALDLHQLKIVSTPLCKSRHRSPRRQGRFLSHCGEHSCVHSVRFHDGNIESAAPKVVHKE